MHAWTVCCLPKLETSILPSKHARPMRGQVYLCQARGRRTLHCGCDFALSHHEKHRIKSICIEAGCSPGSQMEHGGLGNTIHNRDQDWALKMPEDDSSITYINWNNNSRKDQWGTNVQIWSNMMTRPWRAVCMPASEQIKKTCSIHA